MKKEIREWLEAKKALDTAKKRELELRNKLAGEIEETYEDDDIRIKINRPLRYTVSEKDLELVRQDWSSRYGDDNHLMKIFKTKHSVDKKSLDIAIATFEPEAIEMVSSCVTEKEGLPSITVKFKQI